MLTLKIDLSKSEQSLLIQMPNGEEQMCTEDSCTCDGSKYGHICRHRYFIFAMGGLDELKKIILSERRKAAKLNSTAPDTHTKGTRT